MSLYHPAAMIAMQRPQGFHVNPETGSSNAFQSDLAGLSPATVTERAMEEHARMVRKLRRYGIRITLFDNIRGEASPDAPFLNNWLSTYEKPNGESVIVLYPMLAENRAAEVRQDIVTRIHSTMIRRRAGRAPVSILDLTSERKHGRFLEGTGSFVIDHQGQTAYMGLSPRSSESLFIELCAELELTPVVFNARDHNGQDIYHTNVLMSVGTNFAVICSEAIDEKVRAKVMESLSGKLDVIDITFDQMTHLAANILELRNGKTGEPVITMSQTAYDAFTGAQRRNLERHGALCVAEIPTIEAIGGGSVRCLQAEIFVPGL